MRRRWRDRGERDGDGDRRREIERDREREREKKKRREEEKKKRESEGRENGYNNSSGVKDGKIHTIRPVVCVWYDATPHNWVTCGRPDQPAAVVGYPLQHVTGTVACNTRISHTHHPTALNPVWRRRRSKAMLVTRYCLCHGTFYSVCISAGAKASTCTLCMDGCASPC